MINTKSAQIDHPVHPLLANRWSTLAFSDKTVEKEKVMSVLEAARWSPSSYNEQPWRYVVGYIGDATYEKLSACLLDGNAWAKQAGVLLLSVAKKNFTFNDTPNHHHLYDTGSADVLMMLQATEMDLMMHQMAGFDFDKARASFAIGEEYELGAMMALGYPGDPSKLEGQLKERENAPRSRMKVEDLMWPTS